MGGRRGGAYDFLQSPLLSAETMHSEADRISNETKFCLCVLLHFRVRQMWKLIVLNE